MNVGLATARSARRYLDRTAAFDEKREFTWKHVDTRSNRFANFLRGGAALEKGERVAVWLPNRIEVPEILAGVAKAGLTYVGLNFRMNDADLRNVFENAAPRTLVVAGEFRERAEALCAGSEIRIVDIDAAQGEHSYNSVLQKAADGEPDSLRHVRPEDDFCIVYTSGTTGTPKGVWFDHARILQHASVAALEYELDSNSRYLLAIPHNSSVNITLAPSMMMGGAVGFVDSRRFDAADFVRLAQKTSATHSYLVPTQLYRLLESAPDSNCLQSMKTLGYGAAPMSPDKAAQLVDRFGTIFNQLYGMAEIASIGTMLRKSDHLAALNGRTELFRSAGQPSYAIDVRVVDEEGNDVAPGERGEVIFAAPYMMKGYFRDPERTASTLVDGWIRSGDIAEIDEHGYFYIVDRKKDLIIRGGYNIAPVEIESVLHRHPDILEVAVIGVPDEEWGEAIVAVAALKSGANADRDALLKFVAENSELSSFKRPERIELLDALPKNAVGKIAKNELRERFGALNAKS
ncbi:class I adenylate-forming enzyme family protein [Hyphococcus sp.]|uniref:class I adenylate-forming enzyme family protein n=1 Tax=Hyphococcus sp. TaxID=2038636 RepID=UPI003CCB9B82